MEVVLDVYRHRVDDWRQGLRRAVHRFFPMMQANRQTLPALDTCAAGRDRWIQVGNELAKMTTARVVEETRDISRRSQDLSASSGKGCESEQKRFGRSTTNTLRVFAL